MQKRCTRCDIEQAATAFHRATNRKDGRQPWCKNCHAEVAKQRDPEADRARARRYYAQNKERHYERGYASHVRRKYGLSASHYGQLLDLQEGVCAICRGPESLGRRFAIDHNHGTGHVRGLLCTRCNRLIGIACDDIELLRAASVYLARTDS